MKNEDYSCFKTLDTIEEQEAEWFSDNWIPKGSITSIVGDGGVGKSSVIINVVANRSKGNPCFFDSSNYHGDPQIVMLCSGEDSVRKKLKKRIRETGADMQNIIVPDFSDNTDYHHEFKFGTKFMAEAIERFRPDLCIFDPVQSFIPQNFNMGARNQMRDCLDPFVSLGEKTGTTFIVVVHTNKRKGAYGRDRMADSADLWDISRSVLMFGYTDEQGIRYVYHEKSNYGEMQETRLFSINNSGLIIPEGTTWKKDREWVASRDESVNPGKKADCKTFILHALEENGNEMLTDDLDRLAKQAGYSKATMRRAKDDLKDDGHIKYKNTGNSENKVWYTLRIVLPSESEK